MGMNDLTVYDVSVLNPDFTVLEHQTVKVRDGMIVSISPSTPDQRTETNSQQVLEGAGKLLMPGLCDSHMHTGQQLLKGKILDALPMIWTRIMLPFESTLTPEKMKLSAQLAALEMIKSGTTAFVDTGSYFMETAADVYVQSGLRGLLSVSTMNDKTLPESIRRTTKETLEETDSLFKHYHEKGNLKVAYSLRSLLSCSENLILEASERARKRGTRLQAHMNEYANEVLSFLEKKQMRPVEYLEKLGVLGEEFISAHSLFLSENEKDLLKNYKVKVCHCPFSNCGKGIPDTPALLQRKICVGLGSDGAAHGGLSLWNEMKIFRSVMNVGKGTAIHDAAIMPAKAILKMATKDGYHLMGENAGTIEAGKAADFITIRLMQPHLYPTQNIVNTLLECVTASDVCDTVVNGTVLMKDRNVLTLDEASILNAAKEFMERQEKTCSSY